MQKTAMFLIFSDLIHPDRISSILKYDPDRVVMKGAMRTPPREVPKGFGWHLNVERDQFAPSEDVLRDLLTRVEVFCCNISSLRAEDPQVRIKITLCAPSEPIPDLYFSAETVSMISALNVDFDIDLFEPREE